jgi:arginine utilization protein RocB
VGTRGEATLAEFLFHYLSTRPEIKNLGLRVEMVEIPAENHRKALLVYMPGKSETRIGDAVPINEDGTIPAPFITEHPAVVLMGHFDTVGIEEYGPNALIASDSARLKAAFQADSLLPEDVRKDLESGEYEFGRGWLDMKSGVAAIVEVFIELAKEGGLEGGVFLALCPDEEGNSTGIRALAPRIAAILKQRKLKLRCVINADYTSPLEAGDKRRHIYTGTIGKHLMLVSLFGRESHASQVWEGINAAAMAGWLGSNLESDPQLIDQLAQEVTSPPSLLYLHDNHDFYTTMTPAVAHFYLNQFTVKSTPDQIITKYVARIRALSRHWVERRVKRFERFRDGGGRGKLLDAPVPVLDLTGLINQAKRVSQLPDFETRYDEIREQFAANEPDERKASMRIVEWLVQTAKAAPCIVVSFTLPFYPANYMLGDQRDAVVAAAEKAFAACAPGQELEIRRFYPYISDMSFFSFPEVPLRSPHWRFLLDNTPYPVDTDEWTLLGNINAPVVNIGPHGAGAHTVYERVEREWSFGILPEVIENMTRILLATP